MINKYPTKTLMDIEEALSSQVLNPTRLRRDKFGIHRMIDGVANTPIEQEMVLLHDEIRDLIKANQNISPG